MINYSLLNWKEFGVASGQSITTVFESAPYPNIEAICKYLNAGTVTLVAAESNYDKISGKQLSGSHSLLSDGEYTWDSMLPYYVKNYFMRLPREFEKHVLGSGAM